MAGLLLGALCHEPWACSLFLGRMEAEGGEQEAATGGDPPGGDSQPQQQPDKQGQEAKHQPQQQPQQPAERQRKGRRPTEEGDGTQEGAADGGGDLSAAACDALLQQLALTSEQVRH
jgi:hypothetical protein